MGASSSFSKYVLTYGLLGRVDGAVAVEGALTACKRGTRVRRFRKDLCACGVPKQGQKGLIIGKPLGSRASPASSSAEKTTASGRKLPSVYSLAPVVAAKGVAAINLWKETMDFELSCAAARMTAAVIAPKSHDTTPRRKILALNAPPSRAVER